MKNETNFEQIKVDAERISNLIKEHVKDENKKRLIFEMLEKIKKSYYTAPASSRKQYHSSYPGGLIHHTLRVYDNIVRIASILAPDLSQESMVIVGLFHDLGKACTTSLQDVYTVNPSEWHRENLGEMYKYNPDIRDGLTHAQRSLRLLTHFNVPLTDDEYQTILFHDGQYIDENYTVKQKESKLLNITHLADYWTSHQEEI